MDERATSGRQVPVAVVGVGAITPGALDVAGFWRTVLGGHDLMTDVPPSHWLIEDYYRPGPRTPGSTYAHRGAFLPEVDFDTLRYRLPPTDVPSTDTAQLLALMVAEQVLADVARGGTAPPDRERVSVVLGASTLELLSTTACRMQYPIWLKVLRENGVPESLAQRICADIVAQYVPATEATFPGMLTNVVAGRIASQFDLHGTNHTTDAACASSLAAVHGAIAELALGRADLVVTGGVDAANGIDTFMCFTETPALSPTGDCRPFSDAADGTMLGEGLAMFALKRLADAERDGDRVYAVLRGLGTSSDGRGAAIYAPLAAGQVRALRRAYEQAGYGPDTVELVEAHGTGTAAGDRAEFEALRTVFGDGDRRDRQWCALGSVKSQIGHTKAAAGAAGLLKAVLALHHRVLPPTIKVDRPNPALELETSPFYLGTAARPWVRGPDHPRRAAVSSFGFGGSNFHLTLEEHTQPGGGWRYRAAPTELVAFSANSAAELLAALGTVDALRALADVARESQHAFLATRPYRLAVVAPDTATLEARLAEAARAIERDPESSFATPAGVHYAAGPVRAGRVGFLFPGQGAQYVGMGAGLAVHEPCAQAVWDAFGSLDLGRPLHRVVFPPTAFTAEDRAAQRELLTRTEWAQPALAVHSLALLAVLDVVGLRPDRVAGHSFGELVALHCAGVFTAADLVRLAHRRGVAMAGAAEVSGAMIAVGAGRDTVAAALTRYDAARVWLANDNGPAQVVLSGEEDAVEDVAGRLRADGHDVVRLATATAFHSPLVASVTAPLREFLARLDVASPRIPVYGNADAARYPTEPDLVRERVAEQAAAPVRFADTVETMYADGVRTFVEVGAKARLSGLTGAILAGRDHLAVSLDHEDRDGVTSLQQGLARLAVAGVELDLAALWEPYAPASPADEGKQAMTVRINGANYGRPYPPEGGAAALPAPNPEPEVVPPPTGRPAEVVPPVDDGLLGVIAAAQRETARAHEEYQRSLTESHLAFLRMSEASFAVLLGADGERADAPPVSPEPPVITPVVTPVPAPVTDPAPVPVPVPRVREPVAVPVPDPEPVPVPAEPGGRTFEEILLSVVADRTGYPVEMVRLDMDLNDDLGIDSIKRVEIFSDVQRQVGTAPAGDLAELSTSRTLREIADRMAGRFADQDGAASTRADPTPADLIPADPIPVDPTPADAEIPMPLRRLVLRAVEQAPSGTAVPGLGAGPVAVVGGDPAVARLIARGLAGHGVAAEVSTVTAVADRVPAGIRGVVLLAGSGSGDATAEALEALRVARSVAPVFLAGGGVFVTVQDSGGDFGLGGHQADGAWLGGLGALARTAAEEWPGSSVKAIDCARAGRAPEAVAEAIVGELLGGGGDLEVGLRADGGRVVPRWEPVPARMAGPGHLGPEPVLVVTGGARGMTARALLALAARGKPRLLLLGRTDPDTEPYGLSGAVDEAAIVRVLAERDRTGRRPVEFAAEARRVLAAREVRGTVESLRRDGAEVRYATVDIRDADAVAAALAETRAEWGPITGIVHGAGVLADSALADKTDEQFRRVFDTKVTGLRALLAATADDPLRLLCLFSSVAGSFGNAGQADYAMANAVLDRVAAVERAARPDCLVRSIAWGPWNGGMVTAGHAERFRSAGIDLIRPEDGAAAFVAELTTHGQERVMITAGDPAGVPARFPVGQDTHPQLADHAIDGVPVLPVAMVLDQFSGIAMARAPHRERVVVRDLRVLRKVTLPADLLVHTSADGTSVRLCGADGTLHYRARLPEDEPVPPPGTGWASPPGLEPLDRSPLYDGDVLFHGPRFQSLISVDGVSAGGAAGTVAGAGKLGWDARDWHVDPAAADGGLQLGCLWGERVLGGPCLPMAVGETRVHRPGAVRGTIRGVVRAGRVHHSDALCDIALVDVDGTPVLELFGVDFVLYHHES
ncbi:type I polyketide synthase [Actinophytocola gossypii]|uniref:SDR family oxidoreductase n=1 Tax=Actinophytocola gossypii TaxID=2812003 RepID=A0ABT2J1M5_9PSEU|nr:type I polyketide synthase [Actinophytocola gossypii]MCT2581760.1 SDR family oxidoreductase [Actinophytocola gossypii]